MRRLLLCTMPALALLVLVPATSAQAAAPRHCVIQISGQQASGEFITEPQRCYSTSSEALASVGISGDSELQAASAQSASPMSAQSDFVIGIHYDNYNWTGNSTTVVGSNCGGGWLNVSAAWNNRIKSTYNGCPRIRHFDGYNLTGTVEDTYSPGGNLGFMANNTSSIQYTS
jgi:hypothetical protein